MDFILRYCLNCDNQVVPKEEGFCLNCGHPTKDSVTYQCPNGHYLSKYDNFCGKCGLATHHKRN